MKKQLTEKHTDSFAQVEHDDAAGVVKGIALAGQESKNGYRYTVEALKGAAQLYEGTPVFIDHASDDKRKRNPRDRSARDLAGHVQNVRYDEATHRLRGDVQTIATEAGRTFLGLSKAQGRAVGMSHVVYAEGNDRGDEFHKIAEVLSVDAVAYPATTDSFAESQRPATKARRLVKQLRGQIKTLESRLAAVEARKPTSERRQGGDLSEADRERQLIEAISRKR